MGRHPKEFQRLDNLIKKVLEVPHSTIVSRVERYREESKKKLIRPGPRPKPTRRSSSSHDPADET